MFFSATAILSCLGLAVGAATLASGFSVPSAVGGYLGNVAGNVGTDLCKRFYGESAAAFASTFSSLDENHHVAKAIRSAHLSALRQLLDTWHAGLLKDYGTAQGRAEREFATRLGNWIDQERKSIAAWVRNLRPESTDATGAGALRAAFEARFGAEVGARADMDERAATARELAQDAVLAELAAVAELGPELPRPFRAAFLGSSAGHDGWFALFMRAIGAELKEDAAFKRLWESAQIAGIVAMLADDASVAAKRHEEIVEAVTAGSIALEKRAADFEALIRRLLGLPVRSGRKDIQRAWQRIKDRPTDLLLARYRAVPFIDRGGLLEGLREWATDTSGQRVRGRFYPAPGGFGKTRLGIELIAALEELGWDCTFLSSSIGAAAAPGALAELMAGGEAAAGVCVVVDYAESQFERLKALADAAANLPDEGKPVRIVAFARSGEGWWNAFVREPAAGDVFDPTPYGEAAAEISADDRRQIFDAATQAYRRALVDLEIQVHHEAGPAPDLAGDTLDRPLAMAAAAYIRARGLDEAHEGPFETLYQEERRHWRRALGVAADDEPVIDDLARIAAQVTLVLGATEDGVDALLAADGTAERQIKLAELKKVVRRLYGRTVAGPDMTDENPPFVMITQIEPDLLGEHAAMRIFETDRRDLAAKTLTATLSGQPFFLEDPGNVLTVLARSTRPEHTVRVRRMAEALLRRLETCVSTLDLSRIRLLERSLPPASVALGGFSLSVARRSVDLTPPGATDEERSTRAASLGNLGIRLSDLGQRDAAPEATAEAVEIYRELAAKNRDAFLPDLAMSLNNLGNQLSELGQREAALKASAEAVEIRRELAAKNRDAFLPDLASSLNNLGIRLSNLGQREAALKASAEAVEIYRELAAKNRDAFLPDLASSLNNLGGDLSNLGQREAALKASAEAVEIRRELAAKNRDAFLPDLAMSLNNLGNQLSKLGQREAALKASAEAVEIRRELAAKNRDAFLPDLASSLNNLGIRLSNLGQREAALKASAEAVEIRRELAAKNRDAFLPDLAMSLNNLGAFQSNLGQREAALKASAEAVEIRRELAAKNRDAFLPDLAMSLNNLGNQLSELGQREAALKASAEAVEIYRELAAKNRDAFLPDLAASLNNLGIRLSNLGQRDAALEATAEAVEIRRELAAKNRDAFLPDLAMSLNNLGNRLSNLGQRDAALEATAEAVEIRRELAAKNRDAFLPNLALSLCARGDVLVAGNDHAAGADSYAEGIGLYMSILAQAPDEIGPRVRHYIGSLVLALRATGLDESAIAERLQALGVQAGEDADRPEAVGLFEAWAAAHNEERGEDARGAYRSLVAVLDAALDDPSLDPVRNAVHQALADLGAEAPYQPPPRARAAGASAR